MDVPKCGSRRSSARRTIVVLVALSLVSACASEGPPRPALDAWRPIAVVIDDNWTSTLGEIPRGTYRVPNSQMLADGFAPGSIHIGFVGAVPVQMGAEQSAGAAKQAIDSVASALRVSVTDDLRSRVTNDLADSRLASRFASVQTRDSPVVTITGLVLMQRLDDSNVRPFAILKVSFAGPRQSDRPWSERYVASVGAAKPLSGDGGWASDGGRELNDVVSRSVERALAFALADVADPFPRNDDRRVTVTGHYPLMSRQLQLRGRYLADNSEWLAFESDLPVTSWLSGVFVVDKATSTSRAATKDDPRIR
jgi:hypothetical protein